MINTATRVLPVLLAAALPAAMSLNAATLYSWSTSLSASQEVPPNISPATGSATGTLDTTTNTLTWDIVYQDLTSPIGAAHFHAAAPPGMNAPVRVPIPLIPGGMLGGSLTGSFNTPNDTDALPGATPMNWGQFETAFLNGLVYINIHTSEFPGGEIRGQIDAADVVVVIPEPATALLIGAGLLGVGLLKRRPFRA